MEQSKVRAKKLLLVLSLVSVLIVVGVAAAFAFNGSSVDGQITVEAPNFTTATITERDNLDARIAFAEQLKANTDIGGPNSGSNNSHWATPAHHDEFQEAIDAAKEARIRAGIFRRGETFDVPVKIAGNGGGFAGMFFKINVPAGLELVGVEPGALFAEPATFHGGPDWDYETFLYSSAKTNTVVTAGFGGRVDGGNYTADGVLFTYKFRVANNAPQNQNTDPMTISFGTALYPFEDIPVRSVANNVAPLSMSINGVTMTGSNTVTLGSVRVVP